MTDAERDAVGRAAHEAWKGWIVGQGYADHPPEPMDGRKVRFYPDGSWRHACGFSTIKHHPDMVPWEDLPEEKRGKYIETGMAGHAAALAGHIAHPMTNTEFTWGEEELIRLSEGHIPDVVTDKMIALLAREVLTIREKARTRVEALEGALRGLLARGVCPFCTCNLHLCGCLGGQTWIKAADVTLLGGSPTEKESGEEDA